MSHRIKSAVILKTAHKNRLSNTNYYENADGTQHVKMAVQLSQLNEPFMQTYGTEMEMEETSILWNAASAGTAMEGREDIIGSQEKVFKRNAIMDAESEPGMAYGVTRTASAYFKSEIKVDPRADPQANYKTENES